MKTAGIPGKNEIEINGISIVGVGVTDYTRCFHYHLLTDIIAIKFACCNTYYPCYSCHEAVADHRSKPWNKQQFAEKAILCGNCGTELTIEGYLHSAERCPVCAADFNPNCKNHHSLYFDFN